jgi:antitoxin HicB
MTAEDYIAQPFTKTVKRDEDGDFVARVVELPGCVAHGSSESEALARLGDLQAMWIEDAMEAGVEIPSPLPDEDRLPSGRWVQRVPRSLHQRLVALAKIDQVSLNQLVLSLLAEGVGDRKGKSIASNRLLLLDPRQQKISRFLPGSLQAWKDCAYTSPSPRLRFGKVASSKGAPGLVTFFSTEASSNMIVSNLGGGNG